MDMMISLKWGLGIICGFSLSLWQTQWRREGLWFQNPGKGTKHIRDLHGTKSKKSQMGSGLHLCSVTLDKSLHLSEPVTALCTRNWTHAKNVLPLQKRITLQSSGLKDSTYNCKALSQFPLSTLSPVASPQQRLKGANWIAVWNNTDPSHQHLPSFFSASTSMAWDDLILLRIPKNRSYFLLTFQMSELGLMRLAPCHKVGEG